MWSKKLFPVLAYLTVAAFLLIVGCEGPEGPQGPQGPEGPEGFPGGTLLSVIGDVIFEDPEDTTAWVKIEVTNMIGMPEMEINGIRIPYNGDQRFVYAYFPITAGDSAHLTATYPLSSLETGQFSADILIPDSTEFTSPPPDTLSVGDSIVIAWNTPFGVDFYKVNMSLHYEYTDTSGNPDIVFRYDLNTVMVDTYLVITSTELFPNLEEIGYIESFNGRIDMYAVNGPYEGELGNIVGDAVGVFHGMTRYLNHRIYMHGVMPPLQSNEPNPFTQIDIGHWKSIFLD